MASHVSDIWKAKGVTHGKPCVTRHAKENACRTHGKPCVHMHANGEVYKRGGKSVRREGEEQKGKEGKKREKKKKKERGVKGNRRSEGWNLSDQEVKSIYSTRATLKEVGILHTLVYFPP